MADVFQLIDGEYYATSSTIADAVNRAMSESARVINLSLGGYGPDDLVMHNAIDTAASKGVVVCAAGGNGDDADNPITNPIYPGNYDSSISVVPVDSSNVRPAWADYNRYKGIAAPGVYIYITVPGNNH